MRIGCLQFAPQVGDVDNNLNRADNVLHRANPQNLDLLVLPELAFSGYNFKSLKHITPFLEPTAAGITSLWARTTALKYDCVVTVGYPEKVDITEKWPASPEYYNSAITVNSDGETIANYRKTFLYYSDETWALEGPDGFFDGVIPGLGNVAMGICKWPTKDFERMDLNPYKFEAPWSAWEFSYHILHKQANLVILSMAWLTRKDPRAYSRKSKEPDMETLSYWLARLEPVIRAEDIGEIIVVLANRCGTEDEAVYAGTSCVLGIESGEVKLYGVLGRGEKELLVVDTTKPPKAKLIAEPHSTIAENPAQSKEALHKEDPDNSDRDSLLASIDAVLSQTCPISPVEPRSPHAYFNSHRPEPEEVIPKLKSSAPTTGNDSRSNSSMSDESIRSSIPPNIPVFNRPSSPKSRNSSRTRHREPTQILESRMKDLEIIPIVGLPSEYKRETDSPNSASSMRVNTPWEKSPSFFRAEDIVGIIQATTPTSPSGGSRDSVPPPSSLPKKDSPTRVSPKKDILRTATPQIDPPRIGTPQINTLQISVPRKHRPTSPKARNTISERQPTPHPVALANHDLINEPAIAPIVPHIPEYVEVSPARISPPNDVATGANDAAKENQSPQSPQSNRDGGPGGLAPRDERSLSPRPKSTGW